MCTACLVWGACRLKVTWQPLVVRPRRRKHLAASPWSWDSWHNSSSAWAYQLEARPLVHDTKIDSTIKTEELQLAVVRYMYVVRLPMDAQSPG